MYSKFQIQKELNHFTNINIHIIRKMTLFEHKITKTIYDWNIILNMDVQS